MDILEIELSLIETEKALLMVESANELSKLGIYVEAVEEKKQSGNGIAQKIRNTISKLKGWCMKHFTKDKKLTLPEDEAKRVNKLAQLLGELKTNIKNHKIITAIVALVAVRTAAKAAMPAILVNQHIKNQEKIKKMNKEVVIDRQVFGDIADKTDDILRSIDFTDEQSVQNGVNMMKALNQSMSYTFAEAKKAAGI